MELVEAIRARKSIRGYKSDPVPKEVLREILEIASRAPSAMNTQPCHFTVIAGQPLETLRRTNIEKFEAGEMPHPDMQFERFADEYRQRQVDLAVQLFQLLGIEREDKEKRNEWMKKGIGLFDAPAAIVISVDRSLGVEHSQCAVGAVLQTIALAALNYGLGTCIMDQGFFYPDVVREITGIPESHKVVLGLTIGYPDWDFPANKIETTREPLEKNTTWCGI